jgi:hypothetical protein
MQQEYEITKAVPIPEPMKRLNYPYEQLQVGESFWVPDVNVQHMCNANRRKSKSLGRTFVARKENNGIRVWRVA